MATLNGDQVRHLQEVFRHTYNAEKTLRERATEQLAQVCVLFAIINESMDNNKQLTNYYK